MIQYIEAHPLPFMLLAALLSAAAVALPVTLRMKKLQRSLRARILESERRAAQRESQLVESVNAVLQLSANGVQSAETRAQQLGDRMEARLETLTQTNERQLTDMRRLIDQQLTPAIEKRLGQSFQQVSRQLEQVHQGLGEMRNLASGVEDLKKVLQGVKTRGIWGEIQLGALLKDILTPGQYAENTPVTPDSQERVEFAVKLPGRDGAGLLLPIDSKFPLDAFQHLIDASESGDKAAAEQAGAALQRAVLEQAKKICEKYVKAPYTTDFAILFLPVEGLYAEVIQTPELMESLQRDYRVVVAGPGTFSAMLNALQMGFRTMAIEKRSGEVWHLLGEIKSDFTRFAEMLEATRRRLDQAGESIDSAVSRTRTIRRKLADLETDNLPESTDDSLDNSP